MILQIDWIGETFLYIFLTFLGIFITFIFRRFIAIMIKRYLISRNQLKIQVSFQNTYSNRPQKLLSNELFKLFQDRFSDIKISKGRVKPNDKSIEIKFKEEYWLNFRLDTIVYDQDLNVYPEDEYEGNDNVTYSVDFSLKTENQFRMIIRNFEFSSLLHDFYTLYQIGIDHLQFNSKPNTQSYFVTIEKTDIISNAKWFKWLQKIIDKSFNRTEIKEGNKSCEVIPQKERIQFNFKGTFDQIFTQKIIYDYLFEFL